MNDMEHLSQIALEFPLSHGAFATGIATVETLRGGPPSTDLSFVLSGAKSAVSFALPFDQSTIDPYLSKKDRQEKQMAVEEEGEYDLLGSRVVKAEHDKFL